MFNVLLTTLVLSTVQPAPSVSVRPFGHAPAASRQEQVSTDYSRRLAWEAYSREIERLEKEYRDAGFTPAARQRYRAQLKRLQLYYVFETP